MIQETGRAARGTARISQSSVRQAGFRLIPHIPKSRFPGREARHLAAASNRWRLFARIDILALPFASANGIGACLANGPAHLFHISSPNYTPVAPEPESRLMARKLAALFFFKPLTREWL